MFALLKQYRELVLTLVLLALPFGTYLSHAKHGRNLNRFDRFVLALTGPIERGVCGTVYALEDAWSGYVALRHVRTENLELRTRVLHLQDENLALQEARGENERLRRLLDFARTQPGPTIVAAVVGEGLAPNYLSLRIARGESEGVRKGMAVVTPLGVVGKVQEVSAHYADVLLISDSNSAIAVEGQRTRARATVHGGGENARCKLDFAERSALFDDGDLLLTSGTDGVFPKGLAVGRVTHLKRQKAGYSLTGEVEPAVELATVEEVLVVTAAAAADASSPPAAQLDPSLHLVNAGVAP